MQEWKRTLQRQPETLQELGKGTYIQRRNITRMKEKTGTEKLIRVISCEYRILTKEEYFAALSRKTAIKNIADWPAQADIYEKLIETEKNQLVIIQAIADLYEKKRMEACNMLELYVTLVKAEIRTLDSDRRPSGKGERLTEAENRNDRREGRKHDSASYYRHALRCDNQQADLLRELDDLEHMNQVSRSKELLSGEAGFYRSEINR